MNVSFYRLESPLRHPELRRPSAVASIKADRRRVPRAAARPWRPRLGWLLGILFFIRAAVAGDAAAAAPAQSNRAVPSVSSKAVGEAATPVQTRAFEAFKLIYERNMFDPNRRPARARGGREAPKPKKTEAFSLVGTLIYDGAAYAFFNGSEAKYQRALALSNAFAGLKLVEITPNSVKLMSVTNTFDLSMDKQMKREDEGDWQLAGGTGSWEEVAATGTGKDGPAATASGAGAGADEVLRRLMQRREQEMNK